MTEDEYQMARASTLNAHYTSPTVIKAIYDAVEQMGFTTGNLLERACGTGKFFGMLPDSFFDLAIRLPNNAFTKMQARKSPAI